jgi:hypothetical protein
MLTISPQLADAFESGTLERWKAEIAIELRHRFPGDAARFAGPALDDWVRRSMETLRRIGGSSRPDMAFFATTLFRLTEAEQDLAAAGDLTAILVSASPYAAKMSLLRKAFPPDDAATAIPPPFAS